MFYPLTITKAKARKRDREKAQENKQKNEMKIVMGGKSIVCLYKIYLYWCVAAYHLIIF